MFRGCQSINDAHFVCSSESTCKPAVRSVNRRKARPVGQTRCVVCSSCCFRPRYRRRLSDKKTQGSSRRTGGKAGPQARPHEVSTGRGRNEQPVQRFRGDILFSRFLCFRLICSDWLVQDVKQEDVATAIVKKTRMCWQCAEKCIPFTGFCYQCIRYVDPSFLDKFTEGRLE